MLHGADFRRQVGALHRLAGRHYRQPVTEVLQLAHVARKIELGQHGQGFRRQALDRHPQRAGAGRQEVAGQGRDVLDPFAQRRQAQPDHIQAMEQVLAEQALLHALLQRLVGSSNDAHVDAHRLRTADAVEAAFGQHAQQARLQFDRHVADFVQEQGAAVRFLEAATAQVVGAGERAALMAEQLGLQQVARDGCRVQRHKGAAGAHAMAM